MRYTVVHGFCFFKLFLTGCIGLSWYSIYRECMTTVRDGSLTCIMGTFSSRSHWAYGSDTREWKSLIKGPPSPQRGEDGDWKMGRTPK